MMPNWNRRAFLAGAVGTALGGSSRPGRAGEEAMSADSVFELRQYTLHRGQRDTLITLFESAFVEPQNALGARVIGTLRDLDDPDRFVWIRGFRDMRSRREALDAFYTGPVWQANRAAANATILDSDNVLLLQLAGSVAIFATAAASSGGTGGIIGATIYYLDSTDARQFAQFFEQTMLPHVAELGVQPIARLFTQEAPNDYPRLLIREHDRTFVWFAQWANVRDEAAFVAAFSSLSGWRDAAPDAVLPALMRKPERLRLLPTAGSALR
jgi:hypothetical protein